VSVEELIVGVYRITAHFGFMETRISATRWARARARVACGVSRRLFVLSRQHVVRAGRCQAGALATRFFARMQRRSAQAAEFFRMPGRASLC